MMMMMVMMMMMPTLEVWLVGTHAAVTCEIRQSSADHPQPSTLDRGLTERKGSRPHMAVKARYKMATQKRKGPCR